MIAYVLPTRNRPGQLAHTLARLAELPAHSAEVIIVDNAGDPPARAPIALANGLPVRVIMLARNHAAAGRNAGVLAADPSASWIVMLDDDSHPVNLDFLPLLASAKSDVAAIGAEITLPASPDGTLRRESGGLPEVFTGCGVAIRRSAWESSAINHADLSAGYDPRFGFYAEEYDLAARLIQAGGRIIHDHRFRVAHEKTASGRDMDAILRRLVRNNAWVMRRYAPTTHRAREIRRTITRYARIAMKERAEAGYFSGLAELALSLHTQPRLTMHREHWDRFTGLAACRQTLAQSLRSGESVALIAPGKNDHIVSQALAELGARIIDDPRDADTLVIATLSPGPMLDALDASSAQAHPGKPRIIAPFALEGSCSHEHLAPAGLVAA
ncbi:MAG: glycosyltransferase [Phycisphaerales bacterium]|nr:glycosyltransferase [Phycisphaerales bacterium]